MNNEYRYGYAGAGRESEHERAQHERFWRSLGKQIRKDPRIGRGKA